MKASAPVKFLSVSALKTSLSSNQVQVEQSKIGVLEIDDTGIEHYVRSLAEALELRYGRGNVTHKTLILREAIVTTSEMQRDGVKLIVAIIPDLNNLSIEKTKETIAHLHRAAEIDAGLPLLCMTAKHLRARFLKTVVANNYIPSDLYAKIDLMLGHTLPGQAPLEAPLADSNTIIVGVHVTSKSDRNHIRPSVAAVVASRDAFAIQYAGSVREQANEDIFKKADGEDIMKAQKAEIKQLSEMMKEVFSQWRGETPTRMIFFRDGIDFDNAATKQEIEHILDGYNAVFPGSKLEITHVVVNKNTALEYKTVATPATNKVVPKFDYLAVGDKNAKHRYYVLHNDSEMGAPKLAEFTGRLNSSFPLNRHGQTSKALPLLHAAKLARRMTDYLLCDKDTQKPVPKTLSAIDSPLSKRQLPWKEELDGSMFYL